MLIDCQHCQRQLNLPDEKVPPRPFAIQCPGCKNRLEIDPSQHQAAAAAAAVSVAPASGAFEPLPSLRELDRELLDELPPLAAVLDLTGEVAAEVEAGLKHFGIEEVQHFSDFDEAGSELLENDYAILMIVLDRATAPPCAPLEPLYKLPPDVRRKIFVALMASNLRSLDGQTAFYLQVNCLLGSAEMAKFPAQLRRAVVFHLRQYRHWGAGED